MYQPTNASHAREHAIQSLKKPSDQFTLDTPRRRANTRLSRITGQGEQLKRAVVYCVASMLALSISAPALSQLMPPKRGGGFIFVPPPWLKPREKGPFILNPIDPIPWWAVEDDPGTKFIIPTKMTPPPSEMPDDEGPTYHVPVIDPMHPDSAPQIRILTLAEYWEYLIWRKGIAIRTEIANEQGDAEYQKSFRQYQEDTRRRSDAEYRYKKYEEEQARKAEESKKKKEEERKKSGEEEEKQRKIQQDKIEEAKKAELAQQKEAAEKAAADAKKAEQAAAEAKAKQKQLKKDMADIDASREKRAEAYKAMIEASVEMGAIIEPKSGFRDEGRHMEGAVDGVVLDANGNRDFDRYHEGAARISENLRGGRAMVETKNPSPEGKNNIILTIYREGKVSSPAHPSSSPRWTGPHIHIDFYDERKPKP